jgi:homoserine O-acetyltransferase/O-succinyltransferase
MNRMLRRSLIDSIRSDPEWKDGNYTSQPRRALAAIEYANIALFGDPLALYKASPTRAQADATFDQRVAARLNGTTDVTDVLYQYEASRDYNPAPDLPKIRARVIAVNTADDATNPPSLGIMEEQIRRVARGRYAVVPRSAGTAGHGSYSLGKLYGSFITELLTAK